MHKYFSGDVMAFLDQSRGFIPTIRTATCKLLAPTDDIRKRCDSCLKYRKTLNAMLHKHENHESRDPDRCDPSSTTNYRYLKTPEKIERMKRLHSDVKVSQQRVRRLEHRYMHV